MERRLHTWACFGLLIVLSTAGCKSMHSSVPPGQKYSADGRQQPSMVGFGNDPHAPNQAGNPALNSVTNMGPMGGVSNPMGMPQVGTPGVTGSNYGVPGGAAFGGPGTSGAAPSLNPSGPGGAGVPLGGGVTGQPGLN